MTSDDDILFGVMMTCDTKYSYYSTMASIDDDIGNDDDDDGIAPHH